MFIREVKPRWSTSASATVALSVIDPNGQVNCDGLAVARKLSARVPTRLWYFSDTDDGELTHCPICRDPLDPTPAPGTGTCTRCGVQL